jgi:hypothetical protein
MALQIRALLNDLKTLVLSHPTVHGVHIRGEESTATRGEGFNQVVIGVHPGYH